MDPETTEMWGEEFTFEEFDIDFEYEAPRFYDFSRPELDSEKDQAELWFQYSGSYPPSPFSLMSNSRNDFLHKQFTSKSGDYKTGKTQNPPIRNLDAGLDREHKYNGFIYYNETVKDVQSTKPKSKTKSIVSKGSTLTRPTASFLARQNKPLDTYSTQLLRRCERSLGKVNDKISSLLSSMVQNQDSKRQKLKAGYFGKAALVNSGNCRSKVTVPREPNLLTAQRAVRHRSKVNPEPEQRVKLSSNSSKRRPTNKNVLEASMSFPERNSPRPPDFQAKSAATDDLMRLTSRDSSKSGKFKGIHGTSTNPKVYGSKVCPLDPLTSSREDTSEAMDIKHENNFPRESEDPTDTGFRDESELESFSKLCLKSDHDFLRL
ncbi:PREDICTED: uncharacterized protein LOC104821394 isoform X2 [Tarenaya hassleriana]|uniref:uncharacterized protein LOC104821394 isoform X2 n=1 Tax=Tarenaya hassleriana TaxID=28532 RepID=UPI00053C73C7|nr:PREDICTED: uncharacterized protein LOC104821394 isoform X2 [Tarenaya hassleriana]